MIALRALFNKHYLANQAAKATVSARYMSAFVNHRNTDDNNEDTPFEFTKENYEEIQKLL